MLHVPAKLEPNRVGSGNKRHWMTRKRVHYIKASHALMTSSLGIMRHESRLLRPTWIKKCISPRGRTSRVILLTLVKEFKRILACGGTKLTVNLRQNL